MIITYTDSARHGKCEECGKSFIRRAIDAADDGKLCRDCYLKQKRNTRAAMTSMTDNRTTEPLCKLLEERGVSCQTNYLHTSWRVGPKLYDAADNLDGTLTVDNLTPEQAIAATLGSKPDETELTQTYDAGFENGVMAVFQQLEGIEDYEGLQELIAEYWGEGEGYDER